MLKLKIEFQNFVSVWSGEVEKVKAGVTRAIDGATARLQQQLRADTLAARLGQGNANSWRTRRYPKARNSLNATGMVYSKSPAVIDGFDRGALITHRGGRWLLIPTNFNRVGGRRRAKSEGTERRNYWANVRVTPREMIASRQAFTIPSKEKPGVILWCLQVNEARMTKGKKRETLRVALAGGLVRVGTGHGSRRGRGRVGTAGQKLADILAAGFVPMFSMTRVVKLDKRLDLDARAGEAARDVAAQITRELG